MTIAASFAVYALAIDPFAYFRHDDWLILGNAVRLPEDWGALWRPTLFGPEGERVWFFRPGFKFATWLFHSLFGFQYWAWLAATQLLTAAAAWLAAKPLGQNGRYFLALFAASFTIHLGSLSWIGEGLMNCPQLFILALNFYLFMSGRFTAAFLVWVVGLGFKESSVFHVLFLAAVAWTSDERRLKPLIPYAVGAAAYLGIRLLVLPVNAEYLAVPTVTSVLRSVGIICALIGVTPLLACLLGGQWRAWKSYWAFVPYFAVSLAPYLGHKFFSPGWVLVPGFFLVWIAAKIGPARRAPELALATTLAFCVGWMISMHWWSWGQGQRNVHEVVKNLGTEARHVVILECPSDPAVPKQTFQRVVAHPSALWHLWHLYHDGEIEFRVSDCAAPSEQPGYLFLKWDFPRLERFTPLP